ncbi:hypothetical protein NM688_g7936 [Phlebia brevispora]|uniref:Uncharacterized protein n=1 Tax=Phlebia brevispora TaxID=194682 RepID=A0ACC1RZD7_9APHY|nr:hypothetical protein NM688_g7936 [Phlebia brevispora]
MSSRRHKEQLRQMKAHMREFASQHVRPAEDTEDAFAGSELTNMSSRRVDVLLLEQMTDWTKEEIDKALLDFIPMERAHNLPLEHRVTPYIHCTLAKEDAKKLYVASKYDEAIEAYKKAMRVYMGAEAVLPSPTFTNEIYFAIEQMDIRRMNDLVACCSNIAQCYYKLGKLVENCC